MICNKLLCSRSPRKAPQPQFPFHIFQIRTLKVKYYSLSVTYQWRSVSSSVTYHPPFRPEFLHSDSDSDAEEANRMQRRLCESRVGRSLLDTAPRPQCRGNRSHRSHIILCQLTHLCHSDSQYSSCKESFIYSQEMIETNAEAIDRWGRYE
jgi:hypothetical protein